MQPRTRLLVVALFLAGLMPVLAGRTLTPMVPLPSTKAQATAALGQRTPKLPPPPAPRSRLTALCTDGTCSESTSCSGTCSHHGGVKVWYAPNCGKSSGVPHQPAPASCPGR